MRSQNYIVFAFRSIVRACYVVQQDNPHVSDHRQSANSVDLPPLALRVRGHALDTRLLFGATPDSPVNALVSVGDDWAAKGEHVRREVVRRAAGKGVATLKEVARSASIRAVQVDGSLDAQAVGKWRELLNVSLRRS